MKKNMKDYILITSLFMMINIVIISKIKMTAIIGDEINTLAIPSLFSNNIWKNLHPSYYGWGGAIFYTPLFLIIKNTIILYKGILLMNTFVLMTIPCVIYYIMNKIFFIKDRKINLFLSIFIGMYPGTFSMIQYAWNEIWIRTIIWLIILVLLKIISNEKLKKRYNIILGILISYAYGIHGRMIILIPIILLLYILFRKKIKYRENISIKFFCFGFFSIFIVDFFLKKIIIRILFGKGTLIRNTLLDTLLNTLKVIFNIRVILDMLRGLISHTFYVGIASFGLFFLAIIILINFIKNENRKNIDDKFILIGLFSVFGVIFSIITTILFFSTIFDKGTSFIFGRYNDTFIPMVMFFVIISIYKKKSELKNIYYAFSVLLINSLPFLLIESMNEYNYRIGDVNLLTLLSFIPGNKINSPEKLYVVVILLIIISAYILVTLNKEILLAIITGILIYTVSIINLSYIRIKTDNQNFFTIKKEYEILNIIMKYNLKDLNLNIIKDYNGDYYSYLYIALLSPYNVIYMTDDILKSIESGKEDISLVMKGYESLMLGKNTYKLNIDNNSDNYDLYVRNQKVKSFLDENNITSQIFDTYLIPLDKLFTTDGIGKNLENIIISRRNKLFGPYINLRPNKYEIKIDGKNLDQKEINIYFTYKSNRKSNEKEAIGYKNIKKTFNNISGEIISNNFLHEFEIIIENNSNLEIEINSIKIISKN